MISEKALFRLASQPRPARNSPDYAPWYYARRKLGLRMKPKHKATADILRYWRERRLAIKAGTWKVKGRK